MCVNFDRLLKLSLTVNKCTEVDEKLFSDHLYQLFDLDIDFITVNVYQQTAK